MLQRLALMAFVCIPRISICPACDAIVYVYTKTIYDINDGIRSKYTMTKYENILFNILHNLIQNYNNIILYFTRIGSFFDKNIL